ncbi:MAG: tetratricopeptide repeat protein [Sphingomicrobium sp.]
MLALLLAAGIATAPVPLGLDETAHAIASGRLDQARTMLAAAVAAGASGAAVDRLLADIAFADGRDDEALTRYRALLVLQPGEPLLAERAAISALRDGKADEAAALAHAATRSPGASWRAWNTLAVCADLNRDWAAADAAYERALGLGPDAAEVLNNQGWSQLLRGEWSAAVPLLERAAQLRPGSPRVANNLELARAAVAEDLPRRTAGESDQAWAARLNDAGVVARLSGDKARAIAAFTRAIEASGRWYERAWNNLASARQTQ